MIRILAFSDLHITKKSVYSSQVYENGYTEYLKRLVHSMEWVCSLVSDLIMDPMTSPTLIAFLGDLFEKGEKIDPVLLKVCTDIFSNLSRICSTSHSGMIPIVSIVGNHDVFSYNVHSMYMLGLVRQKAEKSIFIADKPCFFKSYCPQYSINKEIVYCLPYQQDYENVVIPSNAKIILSHMDIVGSKLNNKVSDSKGIVIEDGGAIILNGHYHHPNTFGNGRIINVGSLLSRTLSDANSEEHGICILDYDDVSGEFFVDKFSNPYDIPIISKNVVSSDEIVTLASMVDIGRYYVKLECKESLFEDAKAIKSLPLMCDIVVEHEEVIPASSVVSSKFDPKSNLENYVLACNIEDALAIQVLELGERYLEGVSQSMNTSNYVQLENIRIRNFLALENVSIQFEKGVTVVDGINGSGKTSLFEAIYYCITGNTIRGYTGDDIIRYDVSESKIEYVDRESIVELEFSVNGNKYLIERSRRYKKNPSCKLYLTNDGKTDISAKNISNTNMLIEDLFGRLLSILKHTAFLMSSMPERFTFLGYKDRDKLIEEITCLNIYDKVHGNIVADLKDECVKESQFDVDLDKEIIVLGSMKSKKESLEYEYKLVVDDLSEWKRKQDILDKEILVTDNFVNESLNEDLVILEESIKSTQGKINSLLDKRIKLLSDRAEVKTKSLFIYSMVNRLVAQKEKTEKLISLGTCPECGEKIDEGKFRCTKLEPLDKEILTLSLDQDGLGQNACMLNDSLLRMDNLIKNLSNNLKMEEKKVVEIREDQNKGSKKLKELNDRKMVVIKELERKLLAENTLLGGIASISGEINGIEKKIFDLNRSIETSKNRIGVLSVLETVFSSNGMRLNILGSMILPYLSSRIHYYSSKFGVSAHITTEENIKSGEKRNRIGIRCTNGASIGGLSSGERLSVDLSVQFALIDLSRDFGVGIDFLVCDEIVDPFSDVNLGILLEILKEIAEEKIVYFSAHRQSVSELVDTRFSMVKSDGVSNIIS